MGLMECAAFTCVMLFFSLRVHQIGVQHNSLFLKNIAQSIETVADILMILVAFDIHSCVIFCIVVSSCVINIAIKLGSSTEGRIIIPTDDI